jgi:hypothetical protein
MGRNESAGVGASGVSAGVSGELGGWGNGIRYGWVLGGGYVEGGINFLAPPACRFTPPGGGQTVTFHTL